MKRYEKKINGKTVRKELKNITINKDGMVTYNPTEEMALADGWVEYIVPVYETTEEELLKEAKVNKIRDIEYHDTSDEVNICYIKTPLDTISYWADKHERDSLKSAVNDYLTLGLLTYRLDLRDLKISLDISCEKLASMLAALEVYATQCYNKTTDHLYAVETLTTVEEIETYDYRSGYPDKLTFEV